MPRYDNCQDTAVLADIAKTLFHSASCKLRGELNGPTFEGREWAQSDESHQAYLVKLERLRAFRAAQAEPRTPQVDNILALTALQFLQYDEERQGHITSLRKLIWKEQKPTDTVQVLLFLCEVPRILNKMHGAAREAGTFYGSRGEIVRSGKPYVLTNGDRVRGIQNCLRKALRAAGLDRPIEERLDEAAAQSLADHNAMQGTVAA